VKPLMLMATLPWNNSEDMSWAFPLFTLSVIQTSLSIDGPTRTRSRECTMVVRSQGMNEKHRRGSAHVTTGVPRDLSSRVRVYESIGRGR
jgi:hypothetical protein